jgi:multiple sugar transport system ATP-binding protein
MANLEIREVSKRFGATHALRDLSLTAQEGEFLVLLGPTGAGKTTTLRCVAGLEKLDSGDILMGGKSLGKTSPAERNVALVFQSYALYPRKTVYQNMAFPLEARKLTPGQMDAKIREVGRKLNIETLLERRPAQLSGGQQQRVALGRAMVRQPNVFLMDEPLTNLDFKLRVEMRAELKRIQRDLGTTFFYVTNDQVEAMSMADRIAVLDKGVLQQVDTPENVYTQPANLFVAGFVGNPRMNFVDGIYDPVQGSVIGKKSRVQFTLPTGLRAHADRMVTGNNREIVLGIRAEDLHLHHASDTDGTPMRDSTADTYPAEVFVVEPLGDRMLVDVRLNSDSGGAGDALRVKMPPTFAVRSGDPVWLTVERFHLFDKATGAVVF